jgi:hypothetical protein
MDRFDGRTLKPNMRHARSRLRIQTAELILPEVCTPCCPTLLQCHAGTHAMIQPFRTEVEFLCEGTIQILVLEPPRVFRMGNS